MRTMLQFLHIACLKDSKWCRHALYSKNDLVGQLLSIKLYFLNLHKTHLGELELFNFLSLPYLTFPYNALLCFSEGLL